MTEPSDRQQEILDHLQSIHEELQGLREAFEERGLRSELDKRIDELEVEEKLRQIEDEVAESMKPPEKKRWWRKRT